MKKVSLVMMGVFAFLLLFTACQQPMDMIGLDGANAKATYQTWEPGAVYNGGERVTWANHNWEAKWWTTNEEPGKTGEWGVWLDLGSIGTVGPTPTATATVTATPTIEVTPTPTATATVTPTATATSEVTPTPTATSTATPTATPTIIVTPTATPTMGGGDYPAWDRTAVYNGGEKVTHNFKNWQAQWWNQNAEPGVNSVWKQIAGAQPGNLEIATWADGKQSAFSMSFDDSLESQYTIVRPILNNLGFRATFYLITEELKEDRSTPNNWYFGYWDEYVTMANEGHELGGHGGTELSKFPAGDENTEGTLQYELARPIRDIQAHIPGYQVISYAYPLGLSNGQSEAATLEYYESGRGVWGNSNPPSNTTYNFLKANIINFANPRTSTASDQDEWNQFKQNVNQSISSGYWFNWLAHGVHPMSEIAAGEVTSWQPLSTEGLTDICNWLKDLSDSGKVWVDTVGNVTRYNKEREAATMSIVSQTATEVSFNLTHDLDAAIYNYPLTIKMTVDASWTGAVVTQGGTSQVITPVNNKILIKAIPNGGTITVVKQ